MTGIDDTLRRTIATWREDDPDETTRAELEALLTKNDGAELALRFAGTLQFGTAGLRGLLGAGPMRMNRAVVARATAGLVAYVKEHVKDAATRGVCIGYDGRRLSREFAEDAAAIVAGAGLVARVFDTVVPTPVLAFAVLDQHAAAGIMITASHNPPAYNGYKVYWENGAQIIPPHDEGIAASIARVPSVRAIPRAERRVTLSSDVHERYYEGVAKGHLHPAESRDLRIAYTALHGVGNVFAKRALRDAGFSDVHSVPEQAEPDGAFPTVAFPNPEEQGAMDLVVALAKHVEAELVIANDPDADRLAAAVRAPDGSYTMLNGNEIGCLLAHYTLSETKDKKKPVVISTVVSSPMLGAIAEAHGARWEQTLTGFKWIANRAIELEAEGSQFLFGYEEALGYCVGSLVRDKDGVSAAVRMAEMAAHLKTQGKTLLTEREATWRRYGLFMSKQISVTLEGTSGAERIAAIMRGARKAPPTSIASRDVLAVQDFEAMVRTVRGGSPVRTGTYPSNVIALELDGGHRVMLRPSGTEPKIKYYVDVRVDMKDGEAIEGARARGSAMLEEIASSLVAYIAKI